MNDGSDLRSRIEAQKAARREAGAVGGHAVRAASELLADYRAQQLAPAPSTARTGTGSTSSTSSTSSTGSTGSTGSTVGRHVPHSSSRLRRGGGSLRTAIVLAVAVAFAIGLRFFVFAPYYVPSGSMEPTLHGCTGCKDDRLLVDKLSYKLHPVHRGDVVVFDRPPGAPVADKVLVKRVVGLPGEAVSIHDGSVYIDNRKLVEPYVNKACTGTFPEVLPASLVVPQGEVFVMGDNRCDSTDSRTFGAIATSSIIGRAFVIVWPLARIHWL